ncbi:nicotinate-nucleotide pyrophosphorylase (carboxylating) [Filimonas zeae]|uniref:Probable nicotinate-nucleotide pyrophosphorylase [carboxylating] n=1 Tax=Filimonas zeae TaxID=1737353 RepID=A0A917J3G9_9BACT|nr:carboxylating nicotinate-nucleotide diphosphorylase [Filimonas zeae]MDR6341752.1 nicotinate-nucleotide pyrophosphorylase (carboxylating) [Filimonas zeae]GGH80471.1 nicotinate-nucleotide diphosphorylase (carboxylating) [Filimonas zeae]
MIQQFEEKLYHLITEALKEDVGTGDHSTLSCIPSGKQGRAVLKIKQDGILAGMDAAQTIFSTVEARSVFHAFKKDGDTMQAGEKAFEVEASIHTILKCERLVLNCMQRMSGIATLTHAYAEKLKGYKTQILDTRKTTPNFRLLEKEAVRIGGGTNHRFGLYDMIMLKDNHIDFCGGIEPAIEKAWQYTQTEQPGLKIEVETRNVEDVKTVIRVGKGKVFRIMLDNFTPAQITEAMALIQGDFETEASGGINLSNLTDYAATGVDYISAGALIHQAQSVDLSLKAVIV